MRTPLRRRRLTLAEACADPDALVAALRARQLTGSGPEHSDQRADLAARMTALGERQRRPAVEMWGRLWTIDVLWERGDLGGIEAEIDTAALVRRTAAQPAGGLAPAGLPGRTGPGAR